MLIRSTALVLMLGFAPAGLPAAADADADLAAEGRALFEENCVPCHGASATEGGGGDIRGMAFPSVRRATLGIEQMPPFEFDDRQIEAIVAYLATL